MTSKRTSRGPTACRSTTFEANASSFPRAIALIAFAEEVIAAHGADPGLLALAVDLALVVGADRLAEARLKDLERTSGTADGSTVEPAVLQRLTAEVDRAGNQRSVASGALLRAKAVVAGAAALLGVAVLGVWRFLRAPRLPLAAS